eukprot:71063_1
MSRKPCSKYIFSKYICTKYLILKLAFDSLPCTNSNLSNDHTQNKCTNALYTNMMTKINLHYAISESATRFSSLFFTCSSLISIFPNTSMSSLSGEVEHTETELFFIVDTVSFF